MFFLPFSAKHALYQLRDVTQYILALGGLAVSNPGYVVFIIYDDTIHWSQHDNNYAHSFGHIVHILGALESRVIMVDFMQLWDSFPDNCTSAAISMMHCLADSSCTS